MLPKSNVLALVLVLVLLGVLFLAWALRQRPTETPHPGRAGESSTAASADTAGSAVLDDAGAKPRTDLAPKGSREPSVSSKPKPSLRIQVGYDPGIEEEALGLDVEVSTRTGIVLKPRHTAPNEYVLVEEAPGVYIIAAKADGYRATVARATLAADSFESRTTITLRPERTVRVRWRSDDGRPIRESLVEAALPVNEVCTLEVVATRFRPLEAWPVPRRHALGMVNAKLMIVEDADGRRQVLDPEAVVWSAQREPNESPADFGLLSLEEDGPLWASAYDRGRWLTSVPIAASAEDVDIVTPLAAFAVAGGTIKARVIDDEIGAPVEGAWLRFQGEASDTDAASDARGEIVRSGIPPGAKRVLFESGLQSTPPIAVEVGAGETIDLGTIRLGSRSLGAAFRVVDEAGALVSGVMFVLIELEDEHDPAWPYVSFAASSAEVKSADGTLEKANLRFLGLDRARYVLLCRGQGLDSLPRIVEARELRPGPVSAVLGEIVVTPAGLAGFVLDPPIAKGTQLVIESPAGLPLRELEVDKFGIATTSIARGRYRVHLVEYGRPTSAIETMVDSDPFVFEILR